MLSMEIKMREMGHTPVVVKGKSGEGAGSSMLQRHKAASSIVFNNEDVSMVDASTRVGGRSILSAHVGSRSKHTRLVIK